MVKAMFFQLSTQFSKGIMDWQDFLDLNARGPSATQTLALEVGWAAR